MLLSLVTYPLSKHFGRLLHRYFWIGMYEDAKNYCDSCVVCARRKVPHRIGNVPVLSPQLDRLSQFGPGEAVAMDFIGPVTMSNGQTTGILTMVDVVLRYGVACPVRNQKTKTAAEKFVTNWVCVYGFPRVIICDNGPAFASSVMKQAMEMLGVKMHFVLPYHPQSNGACERLNGTIINMLSSYTQKAQQSWADYLPFIVFAYNTSVHSATGFTPYRLLYGREAVIGSEHALRAKTPNEMVDYPEYIRRMQLNIALSNRLIGQRVRQAADEREAINDAYKNIVSYDVGDQVYVYWPPKSSSKNQLSRKLMSAYRGPFTVVLQYNDVSYQVKENSTLKVVSVHVSRMKKATARNSALVAHGDGVVPLAMSQVENERDNSVREFTRTQRQQRTQAATHDVISAPAAAHVPSAAPVPVFAPSFGPVSVSAPSSGAVSASDPRVQGVPSHVLVQQDVDIDLEDGEVPSHILHPHTAA